MGKLPGNKHYYTEDRPSCQQRNCNRNMGGKCTILKDNYFHGKPCPFRKDKDSAKAEKENYEP